ncbi:hypothetical protein L798_12506 [Zootermopsis nevadensis]|uniref:Uncharacterized protein n=1 Tax=Zootermopsis nevadensis TaxID=136037 RepID=A0A067QE72_ZOONE|nr:hypothetical protein L798_12506 [Zootermopsis nevadensis]
MKMRIQCSSFSPVQVLMIHMWRSPQSMGLRADCRTSKPEPLTRWQSQANLRGMDRLVFVDSLAVIMGHEEREPCILETAINILGSKQTASELFVKYPLNQWQQKLRGTDVMCQITRNRMILQILLSTMLFVT